MTQVVSDAPAVIAPELADPLPAARPSLKRQMAGEETFEKRSYRTPIPVYVSSEAEAIALQFTKTNARKFNGIDYVSFPSPVHIQLGVCTNVTAPSRFSKMLFAIPSGAIIDRVESVVQTYASTFISPEYTFSSLRAIDSLTPDAFRLKWNPKGNKASTLIRTCAADKEPWVGLDGALVVEISGFYYNPELKTYGVTSRVVLFDLTKGDN